MKTSTKKKFLNRVIITSTFLVLFSPLYMYFSHDVSELQSGFPHLLKDGEVINFEIKNERPKGWVPLREISAYAKWAIVLSEDWAFYNHEGIDVEQMKVALNQMVTGKKFRGASTITQQMVKNVFLSAHRTLWRKIHEIILAQKVEKVLSKDRILEIYLNCIEFGPDIYGIRNAAYHYFKKHPSALSAREGAFLAMLLPSPKRYYVSFKKKKLTTFARHRVNVILTKMRMGKVLSQERYAAERGSKFAWEL